MRARSRRAPERRAGAGARRGLFLAALLLFAAIGSRAGRARALAAATIEISPAARAQVIDGFGACIGNDLGKDPAFQALYFDDLGASIVRMDLTPRFVSPFSDLNYVSPWFYNSASILTFPPGVPADDAHRGGPEKNNVRTYTGAGDYAREYGGHRAPIAVMGPDIRANIAKLDLGENGAIAMARAGVQRRAKLGDFKLYGSLWSPAPWVKVTSGDAWNGDSPTMPKKGTPYPFIWGGNFAGGRLDTSGKPLAVFNDGTGPTSALQQFARCTAAYVKGIQDRYGLHFYGISIQNELNFPEFYNSCVYKRAADWLTGVKTIKTEFAKYPDLKTIRILGPEDLLSGDAFGMWQYGGGNDATAKNLQYLQALAADPQAFRDVDLFCIHGYAPDGATAAGADPKQWRWWAAGWQQSPAAGVPDNVKGFTQYGKRSWMTETSGEQAPWLSPAAGFPGNGGFSIALKIQQALTAGEESAWLYWQFAEADQVTSQCLTGKREMANAPKYVAAKHFYRFIRPNAVRVQTKVAGASGLLASAYLHPGDRTLTVVLVNSGSTPEATQVRLPPQPSALAHFDVYTSENNRLWQHAAAQATGGALAVTVPAYGVVTLYGRGR